jgi:hypothetical protein
MNPRERQMALVLLGVGVLVGVLLIGYNLFLAPLLEYNRQIEEVEATNSKKSLQIRQILKDRVKLTGWRAISLPGVESLPKGKGPANPAADREHALVQTQDKYLTYLRDLMVKHGIEWEHLPRYRAVNNKNVPELPGKVPVYTPISFVVDGKGKLANLVRMLDDFRKEPLLQRVTDLTIRRLDNSVGRDPVLGLTMTAEALVVNGAQKRGGGDRSGLNQQATVGLSAVTALLHQPMAPPVVQVERLYALAISPKRNYGDLALKNIFESGAGGRPYKEDPTLAERKKPKTEKPEEPEPTPDLISYAYLTDVTVPGKIAKATLFDRTLDRSQSIRMSLGYNTFPLLKNREGNTMVRGEVLQIDTRGVLFRVKVFAQAPEEEPPARRFKRKDVIYSLMKDEKEALVKAKTVQREELDRVYKVPMQNWKHLVTDEVVVIHSSRTKKFGFSWDMVLGKVLKEDKDFVLIRLDERYCSFQPDEVSDPVRPHLGYCFLGVGEKLFDALQTPVQEHEVRKVLAEAAGREP